MTHSSSQLDPTAPVYDLVVFDWDGTLCDSTAHIVYAFQSAAQDLGVQVPSQEASKHIIGLSLQSGVAQAMPWLLPSQYAPFVERYRHHFRGSMAQLKLFDGVPEMLKSLKNQGAKLAVATGKSRFGLDEALHQLGLMHLFDDSRTADMTKSKPHPQMLHELLQAFALPPSRVVMVGDTSHDVLMAQAADCDQVAVTFGAHHAQDLQRLAPTYMAHSVAQLHDWLRLRC